MKRQKAHLERLFNNSYSFPGDAHSKESPANAGEARDGFDSWVGKTPWKRKQQITPAFLPGKFHGQRSLEGYNPWVQLAEAPWIAELDTTAVIQHAYTQLR